MIKRFLPRKMKDTIASALQVKRLDQALAAIVPGKTPTNAQLTALTGAWGHDGYSAVDVCLRTIANYSAETQGPILECGSGLSTLMMAVLAGRRGVSIYSLEHHPQYFQRVKLLLERLDVPNVKLILAPLRSFGDFDWYDVTTSSLPSDFRLVVCDGPPSDTKGGRYGLMPVMFSHIATDAILLLDDVDRTDEKVILDRWTREYGLTSEDELIGKGTSIAVSRFATSPLRTTGPMPTEG